MHRPTWVEIDLHALRHNLLAIQRKIGPQVKIMGIVKANAYGHGDYEVSRILLKHGVAMLGIAILEEGIQLRDKGIQAPLLLLGGLFEEQIDTVIQCNLIPTVYDLELAGILSKRAQFFHKEAARMFPSLEGARKEAAAVADFLHQNGFTVTRQIRSDARAILAGLHEDGYRILHLAGHGVHDEELPLMDTSASCEACKRPFTPQLKKVSGMVIGDNVYLTPGDVEQMRWVPELVFINCCHLGSLDVHGATERPRHFHRLAANIAAQFIRMGVKAVVAAGWAVDDAAAETFATSFYRHLLASDKFGDAVRNGLLDQHFGSGIDRAGGLVQDKNPGVGQNGAGDGQELDLTLGGKVSHLKQGETIHFDSGTKHKLRNISDEKCELLVTLYTP